MKAKIGPRHKEPRNLTQSAETWQANAACRGADPALFHSPPNERGIAVQRREAAAKAICATCPVIIECTDYCDRAVDEHGIYAGITPRERGWNDGKREAPSAVSA